MTEVESICFHKSFGDSLETEVECLSQSDVMEFFEILEKRLSLLELKCVKTFSTSFVLELMRKQFEMIFFVTTVVTHNLPDNLNKFDSDVKVAVQNR